jgi:hypothetical protein
MHLAAPDCYTRLLHSGYTCRMDKSMKDQTHVFLRGAVYCFRRRIPSDLVASYGKKEISFSLKTSNKKEAIQKAQVETLKLTQEFKHRRDLLNAEPANFLSQIEIDRIAALYLSHLLEEDEDARQDGLPAFIKELWKEDLEDDEDEPEED